MVKNVNANGDSDLASEDVALRVLEMIGVCTIEAVSVAQLATCNELGR